MLGGCYGNAFQSLGDTPARFESQLFNILLWMSDDVERGRESEAADQAKRKLDVGTHDSTVKGHMIYVSIQTYYFL